jgi:predicted phage-related endonuclease
MSDRFQIIGASEIAGLLKEYSANLLDQNIIDQEIYDKLQAMPKYLETRYSLAKKLMLDQEQFKRFNVFNTNKAMLRGSAMEEAVKDDFLTDNLELSVIESQTMKEKLIAGCKFPFRATIDYILSNNSILECKTTDILQWFRIENNGLPFNYYIQAQAQLWLHEKTECKVHIAGVNQDHQILDSKTFEVSVDQKIIRAITANLVWFSAEFEKGSMLDKADEDKTKKDKQIDEFLEIEKGTIEISLDSELSALLAKRKELEEAKKEYDKIDKDIKDSLKKLMTGYRMARFKSNQFELEAKYSTESYHDEASINEAIEKANSIQIGDVKSPKKLTIK